MFEDLETGRISPEDFLEALKKESPVTLTVQQIRDAWNSMLLDFPLERLQLLRQLQNQYNLYLLSNTNAIHLEAFQKILMDLTGFPSIGLFFERAYYSHLTGWRKPEPEIYQLVLEENKLDPAETLFIDDNPENVEGAKKVGINGLLLSSPKTVLDIFRPKTGIGDAE